MRLSFSNTTAKGLMNAINLIFIATPLLYYLLVQIQTLGLVLRILDSSLFPTLGLSAWRLF